MQRIDSEKRREGKESLHPMDAELNLPDERYLLELRRRVAEEAAKSSFDEAFSSIGETTGGHGPKRQIEELVMRAAHDFVQYWTFHEVREYERNHRNLYADGIVPSTSKPRPNRKRNHLKVIK